MKLDIMYNWKGEAWFGLSRGKWFHAWLRVPFKDNPPQQKEKTMLKKLHNAFYNCIHGGYWFKMYMEYYEESSRLYDQVGHLEDSLRAANDSIESLKAQLRAYEVK